MTSARETSHTQVSWSHRTGAATFHTSKIGVSPPVSYCLISNLTHEGLTGKFLPGVAELEEAQGATSKKILEMVDRISNWSVFQQATDNAFIRKKMEEVSNTDLKLTIRLTSLVGRLAINIPPPPTDRLW